MKKMKKIIILVFCAFLLIGASIYGTYIYYNNIYHNLIKYEEKLLDIKLENYIENVDGYIILDTAEYAVVKMKVIKGCEENIIKKFDEEFGMRIVPQSPSLAYPTTLLEYELNTKKPEYLYELLLPGTNGQMTRDVRIFIVKDGDEFMYIYFIG